MSKQRYPRSRAIANSQSPDQMYLSWDDHDAASKNAALSQLADVVQEYTGRVRASHRTDYRDIGGSNISGRPGMSQIDYDLWRPDEARAHSSKGLMLQADSSYRHIGLVRNIIDLMGDFACQGIRLVHPNKRIEKFYRSWFKKVNGKERSERFLNYLYRTGNVVIRMQTAKINSSTKQALMKAKAKPDMKIKKRQVTKNEIPWKYVFLHPATVEVVGGNIAMFVGRPEYAIKLPEGLRRKINSPRNERERALVSELPDEIIQAAKTRKPVLLPPDKTWVFHYKKDDWQEWADPMLGALITDLKLLEKLKLADKAALDGAISNIRIFKLGSLEHKIAPTRAAAAKLAEILEANVEAGTIDLIWGPDIELIESKTSVHQFLGQEKYEPTLMAIYGGLGIPPTLTGTFGASGTTNNFISLKTLTQRLEYGRDLLVQFWEEQIKIVQEAMGFRFPAKVEFDNNNLGDEESEKALLIQLADRSLISDELVQHKFGHDPEMERIRIGREQRERDEGRMVPKASPYHDPQFGTALKKVALQTGVLTPGEAGIRKDENRKDLKRYPKEEGEKLALEMRQPAAPPGSSPTKKKSGSPSGRPKTSKDSTTRKSKTFKPKTKAALSMWALAAQDDIAEILNPTILDRYDKSNMRSLSSEQFAESEIIKFGVLCNLEPLSTIDEQSVYNALDNEPSHMARSMYEEWCADISVELQRRLTVQERKSIQAHIYAAIKGEDDG